MTKQEAIKEIEHSTNTTYTHDNAYGGMLFYRNDKLKLIVSKNALSFVEETDKEIIHRVSALSKYLFKDGE